MQLQWFVLQCAGAFGGWSSARRAFRQFRALSLSRKGKNQRMPNTPELLDFRDKYPEQVPQRPCLPDELIALSGADGARTLEPAPAKDVHFGAPPASNRRRGENAYLWVIDSQGIPYIIERGLPALGGNPPKHTNLTGGAAAHVGGEMWFSDGENLYLSGGSGRYPPTSENQLNDAVRVFESYNYRVASLGWDPRLNMARRTLR